MRSRNFPIFFRLMVVRWLYSPLVQKSHRGARNVYEPKPYLLCNELDLSTVYGDGFHVVFDRAYLDELGFGKVTQKDQVICRASSVNGQCGIAKSCHSEGILALRPRYDKDCKGPISYQFPQISCLTGHSNSSNCLGETSICST
jgi:hypothetical protein